MRVDTTSVDIRVSTRRRISGEEAERLWEFYDGIFAPLNEQSPCRQSLHYDTFMRALKSPTMVKMLARDSSGRIMGLTILSNLTDEMPLMPWINPQFFKKRWPQHWGKIIYVPTLCVPMDVSGFGIGRRLMLAILRYMRDHAIPLIGFDHSMRRIPILPELIMRVTKGTPIGSYGERKELDHQAYWLLEDVEQVQDV